MRHHVDLFEREYIQTYQIVLDIAGILREEISYEAIEKIASKFNLPMKFAISEIRGLSTDIY